MSLFRDENPVLATVTLDPTKQALGVGSGGIAAGANNGVMWYDIGNSFQTIVGSEQAGLQVVPPITELAGAVTNANPTSATNLMTFVFPAGALNTLKRTLEIFAAGEITTGTGTTTTVAVTMNDGTNTRTLLTFTTGSLTTGQTSLPWEVFGVIETNTIGSSGKMFGHGSLSIPLTAPTAAAAEYLDQNTAASSTLDLTKSITLAVNSLFGSTNAGNSVTQDLLYMSISN